LVGLNLREPPAGVFSRQKEAVERKRDYRFFLTKNTQNPTAQ
jgi:hypothetical protein